MSLEDAIKANTAAINKLIGALDAQAAKRSEVTETVKETVKENTKPYPQETEPVKEVEEDIADDNEAVTWDEIREALTKHVQVKGRQSAINIMAAHGIQGKLTQEQLKEDDYGKFYADLTA